MYIGLTDLEFALAFAQGHIRPLKVSQMTLNLHRSCSCSRSDASPHFPMATWRLTTSTNYQLLKHVITLCKLIL